MQKQLSGTESGFFPIRSSISEFNTNRSLMSHRRGEDKLTFDNIIHYFTSSDFITIIKNFVKSLATELSLKNWGIQTSAHFFVCLGTPSY